MSPSPVLNVLRLGVEIVTTHPGRRVAPMAKRVLEALTLTMPAAFA
jgi:hypothetical protein